MYLKKLGIYTPAFRNILPFFSIAPRTSVKLGTGIIMSLLSCSIWFKWRFCLGHSRTFRAVPVSTWLCAHTHCLAWRGGFIPDWSPSALWMRTPPSFSAGDGNGRWWTLPGLLRIFHLKWMPWRLIKVSVTAACLSPVFFHPSLLHLHYAH